MATTTFNVSFSYDKAAYDKGETMTITMSGDATFTDTVVTQEMSGSLDQTFVAQNGEVQHLMAPSVTIVKTENVSQSLPVVYQNIVAADGRVWTIKPDGKSATAVA
jgi:hypothetical protein